MSRKFFETYPHLEGLDNFSKFVALKLFLSFPQWVSYASVSQRDQSLVVRVPAPVHPVERDLVIFTDGSRITVCFDWFHAHFYQYGQKTRLDQFTDAKHFIDAILKEEIVVGIKMQAGYWAGSVSYTPEMLKTIEPGEINYTRSWLGTFDRIYEK